VTRPRHRPRSRTGPSWRDRAASALLGMAVVVLLAVAAGGLSGMRLVLIKSGSMTPALLTGDLAVSRSTPPSRIEPGDIVTFRHPTLRAAVTHRVVSTHTADGRVDVTTKGDANQVAEDWQVPATGRVGRIVFRIPGAGTVIRALSWRSVPAITILAGGGCLGYLLVRRILRAPAGRGRPDQRREPTPAP
jgi:signal peptidase